MSTLRIKDAPLLPDVDGSEKIPTGGRGDYAVSIDQLKNFAQGSLPQQLEDHINDLENPHNVTKDQVGLGSVDNTSDLDKPISNATQSALNLKADKSFVDEELNLKADQTYVDSELNLKADLEYVNDSLNLKANTTDVDNALNLKADKTYVDSQDNLKLDKAEKGNNNGLATLDSSGKVPSEQLPSYVDDVVETTTDTLPVIGESGKIYITTDTNRTWRWSGTQYIEISNGGVSDSTLKLETARTINGIAFDGTQDITIPKENIGLSNVDNTSDLNKPISNATQAALNLKADLDLVKRGIANRYDSSLIYNSGERVVLTNGDIVKSTVDGNTNNPNTNMTGWENLKKRVIYLEDFGATEGGDNTHAFTEAFLEVKSRGGGYITSNIRRHIVTDRVVYFDNTEIDLRGGIIESTSNFCNALYNSARTEYTGHYGAESYYRYQQALDAGVPFSKFEYSSAQGDLAIRVLNASGFRIGDTVMINNGYCDMWRVMESNAATNAHIWNRDDVPLWKCEFATITNISGNTISLDSKLKHNYPLTPLTTGIFIDENSKSEYTGWNTPSVIKLNGASNVIFRNINFIKTVESADKLLNATLAHDIQYIDCTFNGFGYGAEITSCVSSSIKGCNSETGNFGLQLRRSYLSSIQDCTGYLTGSDDAPIIMWEGCHDSYADGINSISAEGFVGANIGFYINTSWDCHASRITANNAETVLEISFSHDCTADRIYGDNCKYILSNFCARNISASRMNLRSQKNKSATSSDSGLIATRYSNNVKYSEIESQGTGRYLIIKSFGVSVYEMITPNFNIYTDDQIAVAYKTHMPYLKVDNSTFDDFTFSTPDTTAHNDRNVVIKDCSISKSVYLVNKANSGIYNTRIYGNGVDSGLMLKGSYYTRVHNSQIGGNLQSIDFTVWGGVDWRSSAIYIENTLLSAPNKFKDYVALEDYLESMSPLNKGLQYISNLSAYPQISLYANNSGDGGTVWQPVSVSRNDVAWTLSERLSSATNSINTVNKYIGRTVFNSTTGKFMMASGSTPASAWLATDNSASITPV